MTNDYLYIFDKITKKRTLLGEIQTNFNMSFVIDGTKDSAKVVVWSWSGKEVEPYTIVNHQNTNTWWIVSNDKVERYENENGFLYVHSLELLGAIELFNARDLTDCGFNDNSYTVEQFITRLLDLSNLEIKCDNFLEGNGNFLSKNVNFIKTFENYTLLSALREFLDAFNMCAKLIFDTETIGNNVYLKEGFINLIPKVGNYTLPTYNSDYFTNVKEIKTISKESFGTCVVSNAENVISSHEKIYPATGSVRLSSTTNQVTYSNAILRLPSNVFKGNWLKIAYGLNLTLQGTYNGNDFGPETFKIFPNNISSIITFKNRVLEIFETIGYPSSFRDDFLDHFDIIAENIKKAGTITLYDGNKIVPKYPDANVVIEKGDDVPYLAELYDRRTAKNQKIIFTDKETSSMLDLSYQSISYERGSNKITNFEMFRTGTGYGFELRNFKNTDLRYDDNQYDFYSFNSGNYSFQIFIRNLSQLLEIKNSEFIVCYIPMSDIKIKVDNSTDKKDIQLYNQNGRLTDNVALSKLLNSYSKEINSNTITKYREDYSYSNCPQVGSIVFIDNKPYVISNVSLDFVPNESQDGNGYFISGEYTMSKYVSTKSIMVNPNTNIRDYGIPQNFNVKRKQLYRDYYEINYELNDDTNPNYYLDPINIFTFGHTQNLLEDFVAVMKITYSSEIGGDSSQNVDASDTWYYQLDTTNYYLEKMVYVVLDFLDNNIIGYGSQNVFSGFDVTRIFSGMTDTLNVPISYVDDNGNFESIELALCSNEQITSIYEEYKEKTGGTNWKNNLYNYSVFIAEDIFDAALNNNKIHIIEEEYKKDALEVPVFEYACQIDDSDDVFIGDNILTLYEGSIIYFYGFVVGENFTQNNVIDINDIVPTINPIGWSLDNGATIQYESYSSNIKLLRIRLYTNQRWDINTLGFTNGNPTDISDFENKDIAIFRKAFDLSKGQVVADDLLFIAKKVPAENITVDGLILTLVLNHYKLN